MLRCRASWSGSVMDGSGSGGWRQSASPSGDSTLGRWSPASALRGPSWSLPNTGVQVPVVVSAEAETGVCSEQRREEDEQEGHVGKISSGSRRRMEGPFRAMRCEDCKNRSKMASAKVGSAIAPCQLSTGSWLTTRVERRSARSSTTSRRSRHTSTGAGVSKKSSSTTSSVRAKWDRSRA